MPRVEADPTRFLSLHELGVLDAEREDGNGSAARPSPRAAPIVGVHRPQQLQHELLELVRLDRRRLLRHRAARSRR